MKSTKKSLFLSTLSLVLCFAMLLGTTWAWFTDEVTSGVNQIKAGNLDVELYHATSGAVTADDAHKVTSTTQLFDIGHWEPGMVVYENFMVKNVGNLALKYQLAMTVGDFNKTVEGNHTLKEVLKVAVVPGGFTGTTRAEAEALSGYTTLEEFSTSSEKSLLPGSTGDTFGVVIYWQPTDNDNLYNLNNGKTAVASNKFGTTELGIELGIKLLASQLEHEYDSFGNDYDGEASYSETVETTIEAGKDTVFFSAVTPSNENGNQTKVTVPASVKAFADAAGSTTTMTIEATPTLAANHTFTISSNGAVGAIDLEVKVNDTPVTEFKDGSGTLVPVIVETYIAKNLTNVSLSYNGTETWTQVVNESDVNAVGKLYYDKTTGRMLYMTNHFSTFLLGADQVAYIESTNKAYDTVYEAFSAADNTDTIYLIKNASGEKDIYVYNDKIRTINLNGYTLSFKDDCGFNVGYNNNNTGATLNVEGKGTLTQPSSGRWGLFYVYGCSVDNGKKQIINIGKDVITKNPSMYTVHLMGIYGVELNFKGIDQSKYGIFTLNGGIQERTGNITKVTIDGAQFDGFYLAGFANLTVKNCNISAEGNVMNIKSGNIEMSNCTFNITYPDYHTTFAYRNVSSGASTAVPGTLSFESGCEGYAGIGTVNIDNTNKFIYNGTREGEWADVILFDNGDTSAIFNVDVNKYDVVSSETFVAKIAGVYYTDGDKTTSQELYFTEVDAMTGYTVEKFKEELGLTCDVTFGQRYVKENGEWVVYNPPVS